MKISAHSQTPPTALLTSGQLMARLGYSSACAFWNFVHGSGLPFIRLSARKIVFEPAAVENWLRRHSVGQHPEPILGQELMRNCSENEQHLNGGQP
jgi:predicted DNA-binding transcriptional regulator AlpA